QVPLDAAADSNCKGKECEAQSVFRQQVRRVSRRLSDSAFVLYPELRKRFPTFYYSVPAKKEQGTLSTASGGIVVLDGLRDFELNDAALAFFMAREMGHVVSRHHEENSTTSIVVSIAAQLLFPVANLIRGAAALPLSGTLVTATTTAASIAGSRVLKSAYRPEQCREADMVAFRILSQAGWEATEIADALNALAPKLVKDAGWAEEFRGSKYRFDQIVSGPPALLPEDLGVPPLVSAERIAEPSRAMSVGTAGATGATATPALR
ncbi:hypothetical protein EG831_11150, partial [bacterium]|nr:hypothetical protein [bacterium]